MKKFLKWGGIALLALIVLALVFSPAEEEKPLPEFPETLELKIAESMTYGDYGDMLSIVAGTSTLKFDKEAEKLKIKVRLKLEKRVPSFLKVDRYPRLTLVNEDGENVLDYSTLRMPNSEENKFVSFMKSQPGKEEDFLFVEIYCNGSDAAQAMLNTRGIHIDDLKLEKPSEEDDEDDAKEVVAEEEEKPASKEKKSADKEFDEMMEATEKTFDLLKKEAELLDKLNNL